ncbi:MAG: tRNA uridine-5-carboxymethylaminomethyl(34) synthesis GTPase MnmE, partial [Sphaerochaetaceae bacterium]|nr:tRNA uridine-5-carboxymethylaminomethyl(34) synthesis GTPase MnmE [Sphaerochaetaceae bacterium]
MEKYDTKDKIYALATPWAKGALAIIRASGEGSILALSEAFKSKKKLLEGKTNSVVFGRLYHLKTKELIDEVVVTIYKDGHGYTGEEAFEITCHGGLSTIKALMELMETLGFRQACGGEFPLRAF